jgi:hypothetical protein
MLDKVFGHNFMQNSLLEDLTDLCKADLLKYCTKVRINSGEFVYHSGQIADKSSLD